jgi:hypothetical protein
MCSVKGPREVVVCDVALADVRRVVAHLEGVTLTHLPYEGTLVQASVEVPPEEFRATLNAALGPHGGAV